LKRAEKGSKRSRVLEPGWDEECSGVAVGEGLLVEPILGGRSCTRKGSGSRIREVEISLLKGEDWNEDRFPDPKTTKRVGEKLDSSKNRLRPQLRILPRRTLLTSLATT